MSQSSTVTKSFPALIAALPREVKELVRGWKKTELPGNVLVWTNGSAVVVCAGMGAGRAALAVEAARAAGPVTALVSVGLAGACDPTLRVGDVIRVGVAIDSLTGEQYGDSQFKQVMVTADRIVGVREKRRLFASYWAAAVDMEAAAVARLAAAHGLDFQAVKAISDEAAFEMEELSRFATEDGQFREGAFALHAALRPWLWPRMIALGRNSTRAVDALTPALRETLDWYRERA